MHWNTRLEFSCNLYRKAKQFPCLSVPSIVTGDLKVAMLHTNWLQVLNSVWNYWWYCYFKQWLKYRLNVIYIIQLQSNSRDCWYASTSIWLLCIYRIWHFTYTMKGNKHTRGGGPHIHHHIHHLWFPKWISLMCVALHYWESNGDGKLIIFPACM